MNALAPAWPVKTGDLVNGLNDSTVWDRLDARGDDIVVATYAKSGTTLTQQLVSQLVFDADPTIYGAAAAISPWLDARPPGGPDVLEVVAAQTHRRILKTHLPLHHFTYSPRAKHIFVGRDVRDLIWSFHNHFLGMRAEIVAMVAQAAGGDLPIYDDPDIRAFYHRFLDEGGVQNQPFWAHIQGWWDARSLPNLLVLHYGDLIRDMPGQFRKVAAFLDIPLDEAKLPMMLRHCSLEHMRKVATADGGADMAFDGGAATFINKGTNGRWRDALTPAEIAKADEIASRELTPDCATWLRAGTWPT